MEIHISASTIHVKGSAYIVCSCTLLKYSVQEVFIDKEVYRQLIQLINERRIIGSRINHGKYILPSPTFLYHFQNLNAIFPE